MNKYEECIQRGGYLLESGLVFFGGLFIQVIISPIALLGALAMLFDAARSPRKGGRGK